MDTRRQQESHAGSVSAIVVSYYTGPVLSRAIGSLRGYDEIDEIIIVDNGNFPGDIERAATPGDTTSESVAPVTIISGHGNIGFAAACNMGAARARGSFLLFLNPDAVMPKNGVSRLLADAVDLDESPWMMGAKLVGPDGVEQQGSRRATLTPWRAFIEVSRLYKIAPRHPYFQRFNMHMHDCPEEVIDVPTLSGACFLLPANDYALIDGMDEQYFLHVEDVDFCLRFTKAGGRIYFNPHVRVLHFKSSSRANPVKIEARKTSGMIRYFNTHFSDSYPRLFLWLVAAALWTAFGLLFLRRAVGKMLRIVRIGIRTGSRGLKRARSMLSRQSSR